MKSVIDNDGQSHPRTNAHGCCSCFDTKIHLATIMKTRNSVEFGKDDDGNVVYVAVAGLEAHGMEEGIKRIKTRVALWIAFYIAMWLISVIGVATTVQFLKDERMAFLPAVFCLTIGYAVCLIMTICSVHRWSPSLCRLTMVGVGFNILRFRAANEIKEHTEKHNFSEELLAKCIYPKTKGQHGGSTVAEHELDIMNKLIPEQEANPQSLRSLRDLDKLFINKSISNSPFHSVNPSASNLIGSPKHVDLYGT